MGGQMEIWFNFFKRNIALFAVGGIIWYFLVPGTPEIRLINFIVLLEIVVLLLCQLAVWVHFNSPVTHFQNVGSDNKINSVEQNSLIATNGRIYAGVHIFVGLVVVGVYFISKGF